MEQEACPEEVKNRADVLYMNGFSGFQGPPGGGKEHFVLCWPNTRWAETAIFESDVVPQLREASGAHTLEMGDWIGRDYLRVHWSEYGKRFDVLSAMLRLGHSFQTQTKGMPSFKPTDGTVFTQALLERRVMEQTRELLGFRLVDMVDDGRCEEWNWTTPEGKAFAREIRDGPKKHEYEESRENFYNWPLFQQAYDPLTLRTLEEERPAAAVDQTELCMCCMDCAADTMVLPCEHCVVCHACSQQLETTTNSWLCIKCRQPITHKLV